MTLRPLYTVGLLALAVVALACVTINVYFPEAAVKDLSEKIEEAVAREAAEAKAEDGTTPQPGEGESGGEGGVASRFGTAPAPRSASVLGDALATVVGTVLRLTASPVHAQGDVAAPEISNPAIRKIIESRGRRAPELNRFKAQGTVGENNRALVEVRDLSSLPLQDRATVQRLVREENADRERMFKEIAAATGAEMSQLPQIRETYAETLRQKARKGDWIQLPNGTWTQK